MGYSYGYSRVTGRQVLACDNCGKADGTARKCKCPHGYCQAAALCRACRADDVVRAKLELYHAEQCKPAAEKWRKHGEQERAMLEAGQWLRCSAMSCARGVHVLFRNKAGQTTGYYMPSAVYDAIPLLTNATPDDYRQHGNLEPAPSEYQRAA